MTKPAISFWFEFASTYSYLSAMRIETLARERGVDIDWRPFLLGPIFAELGWSTSPFNLQPAKGAYMWRDMERQCERFSLPFTHPVPFPQNGIKAARIAWCLRKSEWIGSFVRAVYAAEFGQGQDISDAAFLACVLVDIGAPAKNVMQRIETGEVKDALRAEVEEAKRLGIFGAPSFVTPDGELFWGNDRLDEALDWALRHPG
ncbi:2-hydroxychromene-2-carboxylate isomerase [Stappia sp. GBMRC 2046]|uniref:2-hydroxychromene-2-carboxylate isomerase n=1 Tax=Stappia sediminis TaxID=2692190 RepID=A0A7X3S7R8_9HYPH|nr:2-hydroxychromene-2-carboxylate isomerase [Stappia sediminis]MXN65068.1 2-hydroxychromene-2-carboxylate isomerase [Stappia sediminis]